MKAVQHGAPPQMVSICLTLEELERAVANEYSVEIEYRTSHDEQPRPRVIDPYGMLYWNNKWYTVGFCHLRNVKVVTLGLEKNYITTMGGLRILPDIDLEECNIRETDALILPGGETWMETIH